MDKEVIEQKNENALLNVPTSNWLWFVIWIFLVMPPWIIIWAFYNTGPILEGSFWNNEIFGINVDNYIILTSAYSIITTFVLVLVNKKWTEKESFIHKNQKKLIYWLSLIPCFVIALIPIIFKSDLIEIIKLGILSLIIGYINHSYLFSARLQKKSKLAWPKVIQDAILSICCYSLIFLVILFPLPCWKASFYWYLLVEIPAVLSVLLCGMFSAFAMLCLKFTTSIRCQFKLKSTRYFALYGAINGIVYFLIYQFLINKTNIFSSFIEPWDPMLIFATSFILVSFFLPQPLQEKKEEKLAEQP